MLNHLAQLSRIHQSTAGLRLPLAIHLPPPRIYRGMTPDSRLSNPPRLKLSSRIIQARQEDHRTDGTQGRVRPIVVILILHLRQILITENQSDLTATTYAGDLLQPNQRHVSCLVQTKRNRRDIMLAPVNTKLIYSLTKEGRKNILVPGCITSSHYNEDCS